MRFRRSPELAEFVTDSFRAFGVRVPAASRFDRMLRIYADRSKRTLFKDDPDFEVAREAMRDLAVMAFVFDELSPNPPPGFEAKLRASTKDSTLPQDACRSSFGRDAQCELYVAAVCAKAGLNPRLEEPDLVCDFGGQAWGVAVKRVKSLDRLRERFDDAAVQIDRSELAGFVVADVSAARNPDNVRVGGVPWGEFERHLYSEMWDFALPCQRLMREWRRGTRVRGALLLEHQVFSMGDADHGMVTLASVLHLDNDNQRRRRECNAFARRLETGIPLRSAPAPGAA